MNVDKLKAMLELRAFQNFNTSAPSTNNSNMFQDILNELLTDEEVSALSMPVSMPMPVNGKTVSSFSLPSSSSTPPLSLLKNEAAKDGKIDDIIERASQLYQIPAKLIRSVVQHESNFNPNAVSRSGASGLMQLMPATARSMGAENVFDPEQNILAGSKYLRELMDKYDGNIGLTLAAYNAGPGNVDKFGGIPPFKETMNYVKKVTSTFNA